MTDMQEVNAQCDGEWIPWPRGYGKLLSLPFGVDIDSAKVYGRKLYPKPHFLREQWDAGESENGWYTYHPQKRCQHELTAFRPIGFPGEDLTHDVWFRAQVWCAENPNCTGMMLYRNETNEAAWHHWGGRPQFCSRKNVEKVEKLSSADFKVDLISLENGDALEDNPDWDLWMKTESCVVEQKEKLAAEEAGRASDV